MKNQKQIEEQVMSAITKAVEVNEKSTGYRSVHSVYSGLLAWMAEEFKIEKKEAIAVLKALCDKEKLFQFPTKGGYQIRLYADRPKNTSGANKFKSLLK